MSLKAASSRSPTGWVDTVSYTHLDVYKRQGVDSLPSPLCITGSPLSVCIGSDSSIQVAHSRWPNGQVYGWQSGDADSGAWLWVGNDIYGPDACYSSRVTTAMYTVRPWTCLLYTSRCV